MRPPSLSYDGLRWEESQHGTTVHYLPLVHDPTNTSSSIVLPVVDASIGRYTHYQLDLYNASTSSATRHLPGQRHAARLFMQATFGGTRNDITNSTLALSSDSQQAAKDWIHHQMNAIPMTSLRAHYRQRVNPRLYPSQSNPLMPSQPACAAGSRWTTFAFDQNDERKTVDITGLPGNGFSMTVDGEVRTEVHHATAVAANYTAITSGRCVGLLTTITSLEECTQAALALGFGWDGSSTSASYASNPSARNDNRGAPPLRHRSRGPRGCYIEGRPPIPDPSGFSPSTRSWTNWWTLYFNVADTNTGYCGVTDTCICKRVDLQAMQASEQPPSPPASPPPPPAAPHTITDVSQCSNSQCCVVLYNNEQGVNCGPVPIWDVSGWTHPGGSFVQGSSLCSSVRYNWMSRSTSHGSCDSTQNCNPEADVWGQPLIVGGHGGYVL